MTSAVRTADQRKCGQLRRSVGRTDDRRKSSCEENSTAAAAAAAIETRRPDRRRRGSVRASDARYRPPAPPPTSTQYADDDNYNNKIIIIVCDVRVVSLLAASYVDRGATDAGTMADMAATRKTEKYWTLSSAYDTIRYEMLF